MPCPRCHLAGSEVIAGLDAAAWDEATAGAGRFFSRSYLQVLEDHLPANLASHYGLVFHGRRPVAALVAQSLDIHASDLSSRLEAAPDTDLLTHLGQASQRTLARAWLRLLHYDSLLMGPWRDPADPPEAVEDAGELWPGVARELWQRLQRNLLSAEDWAQSETGWIRLRFLVCGSLLSTGPHGVALAQGVDPAEVWPDVLAGLEGLRRVGPGGGEAAVVMVKDLQDGMPEAEAALQAGGYHRFDTEPDMILDLRASWTGLDDCLRDMKSSYRGEIRKDLQALEGAGVVFERLTGAAVADLAPTLHALYHQVHDHQKLRLASLPPDLLPALARAAPEDCRTVAARQGPGGPLLGFVTLLRDGDTAVGSWIGFDKATATRVPLYRGLIQAGLAQAIAMGATRLALGRTALGPKANLGARPRPLFGYLRHHHSALNLGVSGILALLPAPEAPPERHPFKASPTPEAPHGTHGGPP